MNEAVIHSLEGTNGNTNMYGAQSCLTHFDFMDACDSWSSAGSTLHEIFQARILEWIVISYSRRYSQPRDRTWVSCVTCTGRQSLASPELADSLPLGHLGIPHTCMVLSRVRLFVTPYIYYLGVRLENLWYFRTFWKNKSIWVQRSWV